MVAPERDITIEQGVTYEESRVLTVADPDFPDDRDHDTLMDLTGYSGRSMIRKDKGLGTKVAEFTVTIDVPTATVTRILEAADSSLIPVTAKKLRHDLEIYKLVSGVEKVIRLEKGDVTLSNEVTR